MDQLQNLDSVLYYVDDIFIPLAFEWCNRWCSVLLNTRILSLLWGEELWQDRGPHCTCEALTHGSVKSTVPRCSVLCLPPVVWQWCYSMKKRTQVRILTTLSLLRPCDNGRDCALPGPPSGYLLFSLKQMDPQCPAALLYPHGHRECFWRAPAIPVLAPDLLENAL